LVALRPRPDTDADGAQDSVDRRRGDLQQGISHLGRQFTEVLGIAGQPKRQDGLQAFRAGKIGLQPDLLERHQDLLRR